MKTITLNIDEQVVIRMALNDRLRWLKSLGIAETDPLAQDAVALLAKLDAIPIGL